MLYIGIDLGTSAVKALLMDSGGTVLSEVSKKYPLSSPRPGWAEQNPADWESATWSCLAEIAKDCENSKIAGIGVGGQMHGLVILDEKDAVIRPAILWNDGRSSSQTNYLNNEIGRDKLSDWTGNIAFAGFTAPKLLWLRENEPENFARIKKIMLPKDYIIYRLTGVHSTDMSDASGLLLLDVKNRRWSAEMLDICGVTQSQLPKLFESSQLVGCVKPDIAGQLGIHKDVKVVAGAGDNAAAAIGTGTVSESSCNISLGTSGTIFIAREGFGVDDCNALHSFAHADGGYHLMGCMLSAASCQKWWLESILETDDYYAAERGITDGMLGENKVFWLPYLMGERSPHNDPGARGAFIGMSMDTTRAEMTQAVMEGVAFALRDSLEVAKTLGVSVTSSRLCGGGAKSQIWRKIMANVMNIPMDILEAEEGPALGGAMLAAVGCGEFASAHDAAARVVRVAKTIRPDADLCARYEARYQTFRKLYPSLKVVFEEMSL